MRRMLPAWLNSATSSASKASCAVRPERYASSAVSMKQRQLMAQPSAAPMKPRSMLTASQRVCTSTWREEGAAGPCCFRTELRAQRGARSVTSFRPVTKQVKI